MAPGRAEGAPQRTTRSHDDHRIGFYRETRMRIGGERPQRYTGGGRQVLFEV